MSTYYHFSNFWGDFFIKLIKMIVVPLVFFCIIDAALSLGTSKTQKHRCENNFVVPVQFRHQGNDQSCSGKYHSSLVKDLSLARLGNTVEVKELPGVYQTILDLLPKQSVPHP